MANARRPSYYNVFISYTKSDRAVAVAVKRGLERANLPAFMDVDIEPGTNWPDQIQSRLEGTPCVVVLWSEDSVDSIWVRAEAAEAANRERLVQVRIDDARIPRLFKEEQAIDLTSWNRDPRTKSFQKIVKAARKHQKGTSRREAVPYWFSEPDRGAPVTDLDLSLDHTIWRDRTREEGTYQFRVILMGHPSTLERVKGVRYFLSEWRDESGRTKQYYRETNRGRNFELKQLAWSDFVIRATVEFSTRQRDMVLTRFIRMAEGGPFLDQYMLDPDAER